MNSIKKFGERSTGIRDENLQFVFINWFKRVEQSMAIDIDLQDSLKNKMHSWVSIVFYGFLLMYQTRAVCSGKVEKLINHNRSRYVFEFTVFKVFTCLMLILLINILKHENKIEIFFCDCNVTKNILCKPCKHLKKNIILLTVYVILYNVYKVFNEFNTLGLCKFLSQDFLCRRISF